MSNTIHSKGQQVLCQVLVDARKAAGLSQVELAKKLNCQQSMVARIESEQRRIDVVELIVIARAIGAELHDLLANVEASVPISHHL
ncbi:helix-turn-helix transcriptional regulator [Leisingera sp. ANG59]|uniref:helix-turn-helix domain-containing protein n=1 Tax=Leisingera sp. ANG59 TaxID=2675221 RepID=UPI001572EF6B|nr:helix-turn-helix transcriptional regulator [Leisingera sp. ANG59]NSY38132.1 helix-turn-helix domain-containing protein [Leisingera sp. ANG59]